jgi:hypothetical protein
MGQPIILRNPAHWRERAEQARGLAAWMNSDGAKRQMLQVANDYEDLARRSEGQPHSPGASNSAVRPQPAPKRVSSERD